MSYWNTKFKTLQDNYTTIEQSKQLVRLGVPEETSDCYYQYFFTDDPTPRRYIIAEGETIGGKRGESGQKCEPCWSVGRLIEIMLNCQIDTGTYSLGIMFDKDTFSIESLIDIIDEDIEEFDFSKLEE